MRRTLLLLLGLIASQLGCAADPRDEGSRSSAAGPDRVLVEPQRVDAILAADGSAAEIVLLLEDRAVTDVDRRAAERVRRAGRRLGYWLEVGRSESLAAERPDLLASLQGHDEWRETFPAVAIPAAGEVVKTWPWLPVAYRQAFDLHLARVTSQLAEMPPADVLYLNDLQGPPSACGCGNDLCRWATDYTMHGAEPLRSAEPSGPDAAARFVAAVRERAPAARVIPAWVPECEEADRDGPCRGVGCYHGACWREFERQWAALAAECPTIAVFLPHASFGRGAAWPAAAIAHLRARVGDGTDLLVVVEEGAEPIAGHAALVMRPGLVDQRLEPRVLAVERPR